MVISVRIFGIRSSTVLLMCGYLSEELDWNESCQQAPCIQLSKIYRTLRKDQLMYRNCFRHLGNRIFSNHDDPFINSYGIPFIHIS